MDKLRIDMRDVRAFTDDRRSEDGFITEERRKTTCENEDIDDGVLTRAEAADMVVRAANYDIPDVYNDTYSDIVGDERYACVVECAYQNGMIPSEMTPDGCFRPNEEITVGDFIVLAGAAYASRVPFETLELCHFDYIVEPWRSRYVRIAWRRKLIESDEDFSAHIGRRRAEEICRALFL